MDVPTLIFEVAWMATAQVMNAVLVVSAAQHDSNPASSTIFAIGPTMDIGPADAYPVIHRAGTIASAPQRAAFGGLLAEGPPLCTFPSNTQVTPGGIQ